MYNYNLYTLPEKKEKPLSNNKKKLYYVRFAMKHNIGFKHKKEVCYNSDAKTEEEFMNELKEQFLEE